VAGSVGVGDSVGVDDSLGVGVGVGIGDALDVGVRVGVRVRLELGVGFGDFLAGLRLFEGSDSGVERSGFRSGVQAGVQGSAGGEIESVVGATLRGGRVVSGGSTGWVGVGLGST
jgi:hypothetical protein